MMELPAKYEVREVPNDPSLVRAAQAKPGGWVYDIDWTYPENQRTPPESIRGGWEVDKNGWLSGRYARNARYRPITHPVRELKPYVHAAARSNRNQWIVEIDPRGEKMFPSIPEELIHGWWYVDENGVITDKFRENSKWLPPEKEDLAGSGLQ